jgi:hypothetical protein
MTAIRALRNAQWQVQARRIADRTALLISKGSYERPEVGIRLGLTVRLGVKPIVMVGSDGLDGDVTFPDAENNALHQMRTEHRKHRQQHKPHEWLETTSHVQQGKTHREHSLLLNTCSYNQGTALGFLKIA